MDELPRELRPTSTFPVRLISGENVVLPLCQPNFKSWLGPKPSFSFGGKPFLDHKGQPVFAELLILNLLKEKSWDGVWVEEFGPRTKYLLEMPIDWSLRPSVDPPIEQKRLHDDIERSVGKNGGCFDVMAWRDGQTIFFEAKRKSHDEIRDTQRRWIQGAISNGIARENLILVEWSPI
jgi:hypothetical protein